MVACYGVLKDSFGVEQQGDRPVVNELHLHQGLKLSRLDGDSPGPYRFHESFVEPAGHIRPSRPVVARAAALAAIAVKRELGDSQEAALDFRNGAVHAALQVVVDA